MKKRMLPLLAMGTLMVWSTLGAHAADVINPTSGEVPVTLNVEAAYTVALPASIDLEYALEGTVTGDVAYQADYDVVVDGILPAGQKLNVTNEKTVELATEAGEKVTVENGFNAAAGTVGDETVGVTDPATNGTIKGHAEVAAHGVAQGDYSGTTNFTYKLVAAN